MEAEIRLRTARGTNDYNFALSHASPDRFFFSEERFRFNANEMPGEAPWQSVGSGHREAMIVEASQSAIDRVNSTTASVIVNLLRSCSVYQFHDTSAGSNLKKTWDAAENSRLRSDGGNLAAVLYRLEREDVKRFELICRHIARILPVFDRFAIDETYGKVLLRWKAKPESTDRSLRGRDAGLAESSGGVPAFAGGCRGRAGARSRRSARLGGAEDAGARVREACAGMLARASEPGWRCERASGRER